MSSIGWSTEGDGSRAVGEVVKLGGNKLEPSNNGENVDDSGPGRTVGLVLVLEGSGEGCWGCVNDVKGVDERRIGEGVAIGRMDGAETVGGGIDWRIEGRAATVDVVGWTTGGEDADGGRSVLSAFGESGVADEVVIGFMLGVAGVGAPKAGKPKGAGSEVGGSEIGGSWVRISANGGSKELGASVGWTSAWTGETSISDVTSGLVMGCPVVGFGPLGAERGSEGEGGDNGVVGKTAFEGAAIL